MNTPDYIIIGETKCGTTALYNYLIQHPQILDTNGNGIDIDSSYSNKEIRFFDRYFNKGFEWYKSCFPKTKAGQITGEATPMYMFRAMVVHRVSKLLPSVNLIAILRNPVDRLLSHFNHKFKWVPGWSNIYNSFEEFIDSSHDPDYHMIENGIYVNSLRKWLSKFPQEQLLIIRSEDLNTQPQEIYNTTLRYLGVKEFKLDKFERIRSLKYPPMKEETKARLSEFYRPYNEELYELIGRNMSWNQ